ncbi:hypothetical protein I3F60_26525 [Streptomyces sp. MUM 136J]|uniref:hypothetical protein n=1 Tax=Streptomyces sp. MUM 136J TaxID=2791992 RepID=UPI001F04B2CF|nr:hypothetical protein [Streptomyces sp. MUM 136J]MCH0572755.1 hypothetical protein [Streptomyces sp. MUM 136J]
MRTRGAPESRPDVLWRMVGGLWSDLEAGLPLTQGQLDAAVEGFFRIGVHPGTDPRTALVLLVRAHRLDSANPKHPYHVGLLYLRHGLPEAAARWLTAAASLAPANHRVWAHLSLVHRQLDENAAGRSGEHRARAESIAGAIREGRDDFAPEDGEGGGNSGVNGSVLPLLRPGECRWSGIFDMAADNRLRDRTTTRTRDALAEELESVAALSERRGGGTAAFTVLAVQWMVYGYPAATVRRLAKQLPPDDGPAARLLGLVCDLFETDRAELPARLAACLAEGLLPELLTALIHRRRLLWRPLSFPDLGAHAAAREFRDGDPARHVAALKAAEKELGAGPPEEMTDVPQPAGGEEGAAATPDERLAECESAAAGLQELVQEAKAQAQGLAKGKTASAADFGRMSGDKELLTGLVEGLEEVRMAWLDTLKQLTGADQTGLVMPFEEFQKRAEACEAELQKPATALRNILKRANAKLAARRAEFAQTPPEPSERARTLEARVSDLQTHRPAGTPTPTPPTAEPDLPEPTPSQPTDGPHPHERALPEPPGGPHTPEATHSEPSAWPHTPEATPTEPADRPRSPAPAAATPPEPPPDASPRQRVGHAVACAEGRLDANFAEAWRTLDAYPPKLWHRDAVALLRAYVGGHQAEADQRMGRTATARRRWSAMLADDPLDTAVLRNLAVAHTTSGDLGPAAQAWRRYLEALYLRDLLHGDIRRGAAERAEVHRVLAGSFGTAPLCAVSTADRELEGDLRQVPPVLASRGKVTLTTTHLRLEELNHTLTHRGPTLLLGVGRSVGETELAAARDRRTAAFDTAVQALPARIREPYAKLCRQLIDEAFEEASQTGRRTRRPGDGAEEQAHLEWVRGRILWKLRISKALTGAQAEWPLTEYSGDVIGNLRLIDALPLDPADETVLRAAQLLGVQGDPAEFVTRHNELSELAGAFALRWIFDAAEETRSGPVTRDFPDRFRRTARSWGRNTDTILERHTERLDDPIDLYYPSARSAFGVLETSAVPTDERERGIVTAAVAGLERWMERLPGATGPARALARLLGSLGRHDEARAVLLRARDEAFGERGRQKLAASFVRDSIAREEYADAVGQVRALLDGGSDDERLRYLLIEAYNHWISSGKLLPPTHRITEDFARWTDDETVQSSRMLVVATTMARHRGRPDGTGAGRLADDLRTVYEADQGNLEARYHLVHALYGEAWHLRERIRSSSGGLRRTLREQLDAVRKECERHALGLVGTGRPGAFAGTDAGSQERTVDKGTLRDEERRAKIEEILRKIRRPKE